MCVRGKSCVVQNSPKSRHLSSQEVQRGEKKKSKTVLPPALVKLNWAPSQLVFRSHAVHKSCVSRCCTSLNAADPRFERCAETEPTAELAGSQPWSHLPWDKSLLSRQAGKLTCWMIDLSKLSSLNLLSWIDHFCETSEDELKGLVQNRCTVIRFWSLTLLVSSNCMSLSHTVKHHHNLLFP